ncbi:hypothetical protein CYMTET_15773 [Cymbomonas tetramitiformis]|uniref:Uncharacterized protein n=1 Tax=Cymbomonas tetramitiformis TaxID=36881 RepID=A0AAE0L8U4_9CHLO|nr:hypothetical protein CYMTET_15773 [Cymbomonas tetramitiformis]
MFLVPVHFQGPPTCVRPLDLGRVTARSYYQGFEGEEDFSAQDKTDTKPADHDTRSRGYRGLWDDQQRARRVRWEEQQLDRRAQLDEDARGWEELFARWKRAGAASSQDANYSQAGAGAQQHSSWPQNKHNWKPAVIMVSTKCLLAMA